ncbi:MAG: response regulator transcription factor [Ferrovum sp.]|nr:response regulator transcription factor [Ferrovum sp.]NDU87139.1 response regulator transcription factor [Ferrovum sp.]
MSTLAPAIDPLRIALVDDHSLCRRGLTELLTNRYGMEVVGATDNHMELDQILNTLHPTLLVMDLRMDPYSGIQIMEKIRANGHQVPVIILTMSDAESDLAAALRAGVRGYLLKDMSPDDVVDGIRRVAAGEMVVAPSMTMKMIGILQRGNTREDYQNSLKLLTEREHEILGLLAQGSTNKVIARALGISNDTVKQHVRHILNKLNLTSRVEAAVLFAVERKNQGRAVNS